MCANQRTESDRMEKREQKKKKNYNLMLISHTHLSLKSIK